MARYGVSAVVGLAALCALSLWSANHFPQQYATEFYIIKGSVGMVATGLLVLHMDRAWERMHDGSQMGRYIMLLFGTIVAGAGSYGQLKRGDDVHLQNIGGLEFLIGVIIVTVWSMVSLRNSRH
jgi:hypothetical protein